jgi:hypothetical protein
MLRNWATRSVSKQLRSQALSQSGSFFPKIHNYFKHQSHFWRCEKSHGIVLALPQNDWVTIHQGSSLTKEIL